MSNSQLQVDIREGEEGQGKEKEEHNEKVEEKEEGQKEIKREEEQEEEDEEPDYKIQKMMPKQNTKEKLIQQNIKLKTQIYELAIQLDEILMKDRNNKKKYGLHLHEDEDESVKAKKLQLKKQQLQIVDIKNQIFELKRQLDSVFNNQVVQQNEDRLKHLRIMMKEQEQEKEGLLKIKKGQAKAIKTIKNEEQYKSKIEQTHKDLLRVKEETTKMMERVREARKNEINCHQKYVVKKQKVRELENRMAINKGMKEKHNQQKNKPSKDMISNQIISELEQEIKKLEQQKKEGEKTWQDKIRAIELELQLKRAEEQKKLLILRQKEKESKLNQIRIRELRKLVKQNIIAQHTKKHEDVDMSQYRHRRNIRYMQK